MRKAVLPLIWGIGLSAVILAVLLVCLMTGAYRVAPSEIWSVLTQAAPDSMAGAVVREFRLPRALVGLFCGALLAVSGSLLQSLTRNPLADPALIGVSQGAALAVVALITQLPQSPLVLRQLAALLGALATAGVVQILSGGAKGQGSLRLILTGVGLSAFLTAVTSALLTHGALREAQTALGWMAGSLNATGWAEVRATGLACLILAPGVALLCRPLRVLLLGEDLAIGLGLRTAVLRPAVLGLAVAAAAVATAAVGPMAYVGLIAPHLARLLCRSGLAGQLALSAWAGGLLVMLADLAGRSLFEPLQIPAGLVTAMVGVPVLLALLLRKDKV